MPWLWVEIVIVSRRIRNGTYWLMVPYWSGNVYLNATVDSDGRAKVKNCTHVCVCVLVSFALFGQIFKVPKVHQRWYVFLLVHICKCTFRCILSCDLLTRINNWPKITLIPREHSMSSLYPWSIFIIQWGIQWCPNLQQPRILNYICGSKVFIVHFIPSFISHSKINSGYVHRNIKWH